METFASFARPVDFDAILKTSNLTPRVLDHVRKVYSMLALALLSATTGAFVSFRVARDLSSIGFFGMIGTLIYLACTGNRYSHPSQSRILTFLAFAFFDGLSISPLLKSLVHMQMHSVIITALLGTCVIFACFSAFALLDSKRSSLYFGGALSSAVSLLALLGLIDFFTGSHFFFEFRLYAGFFIFVAYVIFDTQQLVFHASKGEVDYVSHALDLFVDFVAIFVRLVIILSRKEDKKRRDQN